MYNQFTNSQYPNFATAYNAPIYGASDPHVVYTATQPVNFFRSFFSNVGGAEYARTGVLPSLTLEEINNSANWSTKPYQDDFDTFQRLQYLAQGGNAGLIGRDVDRYAQQRAILGYGANPYYRINKQIVENLGPTELQKLGGKDYVLETLKQEIPDAVTDPETGEEYYVDAKGKRTPKMAGATPALKLGDQFVAKERLDSLGKLMLQQGTNERIQESLEGEGSLPSLVLKKVFDIPSLAGESEIELETKKVLGDASLAYYESMANPFNSAGIGKDIEDYVNYQTEEEKKFGFDGVKWFNENINPEVVPYLAQKGITSDSIIGVGGARKALSIIQMKLAENTIQERMEAYSSSSSWTKTNILTTAAYGLPTMMLNDPDMAVTLGVAIATAGAGLVAKGSLAALQGISKSASLANNIKTLSSTINKSKALSAAKGLYSLSMGDLPLWFKNYSSFQKVSLGAGIAGLTNAGASIRDQQNRIAFASTALYNELQDDFSYSELGTALLMGAAFGGLIGTVAHIGGREYKVKENGRLQNASGLDKSLIGPTPEHRAMLDAGLKAAQEENSTVNVERPKDILTGTGEEVVDDTVEVVDQTGKRIRVKQEDIAKITEVETEKVLSGEYRRVRNTATKEDILVRQSTIDAIKGKEKSNIVPEEAPLANEEQHVIRTTEFTDAADVARKAGEADGLASLHDSTVFNRATGETDNNFATRLINADQVNTAGDVLRLVSKPKDEPRGLLNKLVAIKRSTQEAKKLISTTPHNKPKEWVAARIKELDKFEAEELDAKIQKVMDASTNSAFQKLPPATKQSMTKFVIEHSGKTDDEINKLIKNSSFKANEKKMLKTRLLEKKTTRSMLDEVLADEQLSPSSRKILTSLLGTPENLSLLERNKATKSFRKEGYFRQTARKSVVNIYDNIKDGLINSLDMFIGSEKQLAKQNIEATLSLIRASLANLNLIDSPNRRIVYKFEKLSEATLGQASMSPDGKQLTITINNSVVFKALRSTDQASITTLTHLMLHELGHTYAYLATPEQVLRLAYSYSTIVDPALHDAIVKITRSLSGRESDLYSVANPSEFFANYFANKNMTIAMTAAENARLSILGSFVRYVQDVFDGLVSDLNMNRDTKILLKKINTELSNLVDDIGSLRDMFSPDMVDIAQADKKISTLIYKSSYYYGTKTLEEFKNNIRKAWFSGSSELVKLKDDIKSALADIAQPQSADKLDLIVDNIILEPERLLANLFSISSTQDIKINDIQNIFNAAEVTSTQINLLRYIANYGLGEQAIKALNPQEIKEFIATSGTMITPVIYKTFAGRLFLNDNVMSKLNYINNLANKANKKQRIQQNVFITKSKFEVTRPVFDNGLEGTNRIIYHSGTFDHTASTPLFLHTGTLKAAFDRTAWILDSSGPSSGDYKMTAFEINENANVIEMIDGLSGHTSIENYFRDINDNLLLQDTPIDVFLSTVVSSKKQADEIIKRLDALYKKERTQKYEGKPAGATIGVDTDKISNFEDFKKILVDAGIDIIRYRNRGEDIGSTSYVIINPEKVTVKAVGYKQGVLLKDKWGWVDTQGNPVDSFTSDVTTPFYSSAQDIQDLVTILPNLKSFIADFAEAVEEPVLEKFTPTSFTEVTPENKETLQQQVNNLISNILVNNKFKKSIAANISKYVKNFQKVSVDEVDDLLSEVLIASQKQIDKNKIPNILTVSTEKELNNLLTGFKKKRQLKEFREQTKDGKVVSYDSFKDPTAVLGEDRSDAGMDTDISQLATTEMWQAKFSAFQKWLFSGNGSMTDENVFVMALLNARFDGGRVRSTKAGQLPNLPKGAAERVFLELHPEDADAFKVAKETNDEETLLAIDKKIDNWAKNTNKRTKKLLKEFEELDSKQKPRTSEAVLFDSIQEKALSDDRPLQAIVEEKAANIEADNKQTAETNNTIKTPEAEVEVSFPVIRGIGDSSAFISSDWDGNMDSFKLGLLFTNEKKAAGVRKNSKSPYTVRVELDKSKVFRLAIDPKENKSILDSIKEVPDVLLRTAGINKDKFKIVLDIIKEGHSEEEALRVVLASLYNAKFTAIEIVEKSGKLVGHIPTNEKHIKVIKTIEHAALETAEKLKPEESPLKDPPESTVNPKKLPVETKNGEPVIPETRVLNKESDVANISEEERFVHGVLNAKETLRDNGTTPKIVKLALGKFYKAAKELRENIGVNLTGIPEDFKVLLYRVVRAAEMIADENKTRFGEAYEVLNNEFWTIFDRELSKEIVARGVPEEKITVRTIDDIVEFAHAKINENIKLRNERNKTNLPEFLKPLSVNDFNFASSKVTNKYPDLVSFKKDSLAETMDKRAEKAMREEPKSAITKEEVNISDDEIKNKVLGSINNSPKDNTLLLREGNLIGWIFGGSERSSRNWWRKLMTTTANFIEARTGVGSTTRSLSNIVRTVSAFADKSKAHVHNLVAGGKNAIKSWEQCSHEAYRMTTKLRDNTFTLAKSVGSEKIYSLISIEIMKSFATKKALNRVDIEAAIKTLIPNPSKEFVDTVMLNTKNLYDSVVEINTNLINLENETNFISLLDKQGNPVKPTEYFPITFVGEKVTQDNFDSVIQEMVKVRRATLIASDELDTTVMLSMGWLYNKEGNILNKGRKLEGRQQHFLDEANFDKQTLINLEVERYPANSMADTFIEMNGESSKKHFTYVDQNTGELVVCRIPEKKLDLSVSDLAKYNEVVNGSTKYNGKQWKLNDYGNKNVVDVMMTDLLNAKLYRGRFSSYLAPKNANPMNPMLSLKDKTRLEHGTYIENLSWDEIMSSKVLQDIVRSDPLEAYGNFVKSRGFELLVQKEVDRLTGTTGVRFSKFMEILKEQALSDASALNGEEGIKHVQAGFTRLSEDYLAYQGRIGSVHSSYNSTRGELVEMGLNLVKGISGTIWGITGSAEPATHLLLSPFTVGPVQSVKNIWETVRILIGDKRFSVGAALTDDMRETQFFIDLVRSDMEDRILNIDGNGVPKLTKYFDRVSATRKDSRFGIASDLTDWFGNVGVEIGSSRYTTFLARKFAMQRFSKRFATFINNGAAEKLFTKLNEPATFRTMKTLEEASISDPKAAKELTRMFKELSREAGFGGRWDIAIAMNKYGVNTVEKIAALKAAFNKLGKQYSVNGLVNWSELRALFDEHSNTPVLTGIDPKIGKAAYESFIFACETLTTTEGAISSSRGLNRELSLEARTPMGRLMKSLLGWSQSFYNNVLGNYGGMTAATVMGSLIMYSGLTAVSDLLKEWLQGRDVKDITEEMKQNPETLLFRMANSVPVLGHLSGNLQYLLAKLSEQTGGPLSAFRTPMAPPALMMAAKYPADVASSLYNAFTTSIPQGDGPQVMKDLGVLGMNNLFNNSPFAVPARLMVEAGAINEADAMGKYLKLIKKKKNKYTGNTNTMDIKVNPVDPKRQQELINEIKRNLRNKQVGNSRDLAPRLKDMSNKNNQ